METANIIFIIILAILSGAVYIQGWSIQTLLDKYDIDEVNNKLKASSILGIVLGVIICTVIIGLIAFSVKQKQTDLLNWPITILSFIISIGIIALDGAIINIRLSKQTNDVKSNQLEKLSSYSLGIGGILFGVLIGYGFGKVGK